MGWLSDAWDAATDAAGDVVDAAGDVVEGVADAAGNAVQGAVNAAGNAMGDAFGLVQGVGGGTLNVLDDFVFDPVDFVTHGAIDVDYDDGNFSAGIDVGVAHTGIHFGEDGFGAGGGFNFGVVHGAASAGSDGISTGGGFNIGVASGSVGFDDDTGFHLGGSLGVNFGPLPFVEGHIDVAPDGGISIGGELQGVLPGLHPDVEVNLFGGAGGEPTTSDLDGDFDDGIPAQLDQAAIAADLDQLDTDALLAVDLPDLDDQPDFDDQPDDQPVFARVTDTVSDLAASGDLSDVLGDMDGSDGGVAQQIDAVGQLVEDDSFDDFTSDVIGSELTEASADDVWSGIGDDVDG